jgi:hypothetical protein
MDTSRNHGKVSKAMNRSRSSSRIQKPCFETLVTSTREVGSPRVADFILMLPNQPLGA